MRKRNTTAAAVSVLLAVSVIAAGCGVASRAQDANGTAGGIPTTTIPVPNPTGPSGPSGPVQRRRPSLVC